MVLSPVGVVDQYVILTLQQIRWQVVNPAHSLHVGLTGQQEEVTCLLFQMVILTFSDGDSLVLARSRERRSDPSVRRCSSEATHHEVSPDLYKRVQQSRTRCNRHHGGPA